METCQFRPPSILSIFFYLRPHKSYIFGKYRSNPIQWRWFQSSSSRSGRSGWSGMSSKSREVLDDYFSTQTPCILYFWKPWAESSSMEGTPSIMITIRKVRKARMIRTSSKYTEVRDEFFSNKYPIYHIFLKILGEIQVNIDDPRHHDCHQECQEGQGDQDFLQVHRGSW